MVGAGNRRCAVGGLALPTCALQLPPFDAMGTPVELMRAFEGRAGFERAIAALEAALYGGA